MRYLLLLLLVACSPADEDHMTRFLRASRASWTPATMTLTGWYKPAYHYAPTADPWLGTASAGTSGSNALSYNGSSSTLATLNGLSVGVWDGVHDSIWDEQASFSISRHLKSDGYSGAYLIKPTQINAPQGGYDQRSSRGIFNDGGQTKLSLNIDSTDGVTLCHVDSGGLKTASTGAFAANAWTLIQYGYDKAAGKLWVKKDSAARVETSGVGDIPAPFDATGTFHNFDNWGGGGSDALSQSHFEGQVAEILASWASFTPTESTNLITYVNAKFALSL